MSIEYIKEYGFASADKNSLASYGIEIKFNGGKENFEGSDPLKVKIEAFDFLLKKYNPQKPLQ